MGTKFKHCEIELGAKSEALTGQERAVVMLLALGLTNKEIAQRTGKSPGTTKKVLDRLMIAFGVGNRGAIIAQAFCHGVLVSSSQALTRR